MDKFERSELMKRFDDCIEEINSLLRQIKVLQEEAKILTSKILKDIEWGDLND